MRIISRGIPHGLFGSTFIWILELLAYFDENCIIHNWDIIVYNANINSLLVQKQKGGSAKIIDFCKLKNEHGKNENLKYNFKYAHELWNKYFEFHSDILIRVPDVEPDTLGIHYRGTDKLRDKKETNPLPIEEFYIILKDFLVTHNVKHIFICTDHEQSLKYLLQKLNNYDVKYNAFLRSTNAIPVHHVQNKTKAIQSMIDMLTLSRCKYVLKSSSALSSWAKIINPDLEIYTTQAFKKVYFPNSCIPLYKPFSRDAINIMKKSCVEHYVHPFEI